MEHRGFAHPFPAKNPTHMRIEDLAQRILGFCVFEKQVEAGGQQKECQFLVLSACSALPHPSDCQPLESERLVDAGGLDGIALVRGKAHITVLLVLAEAQQREDDVVLVGEHNVALMGRGDRGVGSGDIRG